MKRKNDNWISILLLTVIIFSTILIIKINNDNDSYSKEMYDNLYKDLKDWDNEEFITASDYNKEERNNLEKEQVKVISATEASYKIIATIRIPKINLYYPIISETSDDNLKISPSKLYGCDPNQIGNFCVIGHNLGNEKFFGRLKTLNQNDNIILKGKDGSEETYKVYDMYTVDPTDLSCLSQETNGKKEVTLITCTNKNNKRLVVKCRV